jgi:large subunit ribosomal protein L25
MELKTLNVMKRDQHGTGPARRTRVAGDVPGVIYGEGQAAVSISVNTRSFEQLIHGEMGEHAVVQLEVEGQPSLSGPAMIKAVQHHPVRSHVIHADFLRIRLDERIHTVVALNLVGRAKGIQEGGVPDQQLHEVEVECLALDVPPHIDVDISELNIGDSIHVEQLQAPKGVDITTDPERAVIAIHPPRILEDAELTPEELEARQAEAALAAGEGEAEGESGAEAEGETE